MISVIVVYNNSQINESLILSSIRNQSVAYELILIDNVDNKNYNSAASALNAGASQANGELLMFVHQDVDLLDIQFLEKVESMLHNVKDLGVAGVAGMDEHGNNHKERQRNIIYHGVPIREWGNEIQDIERVQTLDECLLIVPSVVFKRIQFDEKTCDNWHLYGVDYCLMLSQQKLSIYVLPLPIYHRSAGDSATNINNFMKGSLASEYFTSFEAVRKKHKQHLLYIHTTCASYSTFYPILLQRAFRYCMRSIRSTYDRH